VIPSAGQSEDVEDVVAARGSEGRRSTAPGNGGELEEIAAQRLRALKLGCLSSFEAAVILTRTVPIRVFRQ